MIVFLATWAASGGDFPLAVAVSAVVFGFAGVAAVVFLTSGGARVEHRDPGPSRVYQREGHVHAACLTCRRSIEPGDVHVRTDCRRGRHRFHAPCYERFQVARWPPGNHPTADPSDVPNVCPACFDPVEVLYVSSPATPLRSVGI